jgi:hypothetical protein
MFGGDNRVFAMYIVINFELADAINARRTGT